VIFCAYNPLRRVITTINSFRPLYLFDFALQSLIREHHTRIATQTTQPTTERTRAAEGFYWYIDQCTRCKEYPNKQQPNHQYAYQNQTSAHKHNKSQNKGSIFVLNRGEHPQPNENPRQHQQGHVISKDSNRQQEPKKDSSTKSTKISQLRQ
jgi:hypothetical protein